MKGQQLIFQDQPSPLQNPVIPANIASVEPPRKKRRLNHASDVRKPAAVRLKNEPKKYDPRVNVYFDEKAWATQPVCNAWMDDFVENIASKNEETLLGLDNLSTQKTDVFQKRARDGNVLLDYTPDDCTDLCAVSDCNIGNKVKKLMCGMYEADLETRLDDWVDGKVSASERRILFTKWLGEAWDIMYEKHFEMIERAFQRCGMLNAMDGSENDLLTVPGVPEYKIPVPGSDESSLCAMCFRVEAQDCQTPLQRWIGCDVCTRWYHTECMGDDVNEEDERALCPVCCLVLDDNDEVDDELEGN